MSRCSPASHKLKTLASSARTPRDWETREKPKSPKSWKREMEDGHMDTGYRILAGNRKPQGEGGINMQHWRIVEFFCYLYECME